jgi:hypothetical protein
MGLTAVIAEISAGKSTLLLPLRYHAWLACQADNGYRPALSRQPGAATKQAAAQATRVHTRIQLFANCYPKQALPERDMKSQKNQELCVFDTHATTLPTAYERIG